MENSQKSFYTRKPEWLKIRLPRGVKSARVAGNLNGRCLHSICESGLCPNRGECWTNGTATFMIGGDTCTRACRFCNVKTGRPAPLDSGEIDRVVKSVVDLNLKHVVITSVDRDDLPDGGANHWASMIRALRRGCPGVTMEVLIPDFRGDAAALRLVIDERPDVISHNIETVRRLTPAVRSVATYDGSLEVVRQVAAAGIRSKSGLMLGLGETPAEVETALADLRGVGCEVVTIGQYLQPTEAHYPVAEYIHPDDFERYRLMALEMGFRHVESAPLVRSSYHAERHVI